MQTRRRFGAVAAMLTTIAFAVASPRGAASAAGSSVAGDSVASASPAGVTAAPSAAELATLRQRVDGHVARVRVGADDYDIRGARFDSSGVAFAPGDARAVARWERQGGAGTLALPGSLGSPVGWDRIEGITVRKPCGTRGATMGGLVGAAGYIAILAVVSDSGRESFAPLVLLPLPGVTALLGAAVGSLVHRVEPGWERSVIAPAASAVAPATATRAPAAGAPPFALGILRADIARHPVRLWIGGVGYEAERVRLEPSGIAFDPARLREVSRPAAAGGGEAATRATPPSTPIAWDQVDRIESRRPSGRRGAAWGMVVVPAAVVLAKLARGNTTGNALGGAVLAGVPAGALVGTGIGAFVPHSEPEWDRSGPAGRARP